jgi:phage terminase large subunit-like protein
LYHKHDANFVVVEINNGGDFIKTMIQQRDRTVRVTTVRATKGKAIRAQPVQALYEQGLVHHVGRLPELEHEMCTWVPDSGMRSPNRIDWCVWAVTKLIKKKSFICV